MKGIGKLFKRNTSKLLMASMVSVLFAATGCSLFGSSDKSTETGSVSTDRTLWHSRQQYVRIERQDNKSTGPNEHPIMLSPDQIRNALSQLLVKLTSKDKPIPVFTGSELDLLSQQISQGLAQAGPDQDVTFAVIGDRRALYGLAKQRKLTTGRVFYRTGKLNVIFGRMLEDIGYYDDDRLNPLTPGSRARAVNHVWTIEEEPDMHFYAGGEMLRSDWLVIDLASMAANEALGVQPTRTGSVSAEAPATAPERIRTTQEAAPAQVPVYQSPVTSQTPQAGKSSKTIEERLLILNELKKKNLVTEDEYKKKRAEILNDL